MRCERDIHEDDDLRKNGCKAEATETVESIDGDEYRFCAAHATEARRLNGVLHKIATHPGRARARRVGARGNVVAWRCASVASLGCSVPSDAVKPAGVTARMNIPDAHTSVNVPMSVLAHALVRHVTVGGRTAHELTVRITPEASKVYEHLPVVTVCLGQMVKSGLIESALKRVPGGWRHPGNGDFAVYYSLPKKGGGKS